MKIYIDTANIEEIREAESWGILDGVTTNPSLVAREKRPYEEVVREICGIVDGPVSAESVGMDADTIVEEGRTLAAIHDQVVVKVPVLGVAAVSAQVTLRFSLVSSLPWMPLPPVGVSVPSSPSSRVKEPETWGAGPMMS